MSVGRVAVFGGRGCLGSFCVQELKYAKWWVASIDRSKNEAADLNIIVAPSSDNWLEQERQVLTEMGNALKHDDLDAVLCFAGGWTGGNATQNLSRQTDLMWKQSVMSSAIAASLATKYLAPKGLLVLTGARSAMYGTPGMIGYGMAKAAVHHLTKSLGAKNSGLPKNASVIGILPDILDTEANRVMMPTAYRGSWTPLSFIYDLIRDWLKGEDIPPSGSLLAIITADNVTRVTRLQEEVDPNIVIS